MLDLESRCILVGTGGVLISIMRSNHKRINKELQSLSILIEHFFCFFNIYMHIYNSTTLEA